MGWVDAECDGIHLRPMVNGGQRDWPMSNKTAKDEMMQAHEAMARVLDVKLQNMPEWQAFRAIDRALLALDSVAGSRASAPIPRPRINGTPDSYTTLTGKALEELGQPITTPKLVEFIRKHRDLGDDLARVRVSISTSLSKDPRYKSVEWGNGRGWWYADKPLPDPAGMKKMF
jgi:hypothetical protein